jgi:DNA-binding CsgD family transcriptional regulator
VEEIVGREAELQAVLDALATPPPTAIVLEGEAGIGKTALWERGIDEAAGRGMRVLVTRPVEAETGLSYAGLGDVVGPLMDELPGDFPAPQRRALDVALLRTPADSGPLDPRAVGAATLGALRAAAGRESVVVGVDDVQWLDGASAAAMWFALRRLDAVDGVMLLATRRTQAGEGPLDVGLPAERLTRIPVGSLDAKALIAMLRLQLAETLPPPTLSKIVEVSGGSPYFALELGRAALRQPGGKAFGAGLPVPEALSTVLQDRLRALPSETGEGLATVAAMAQPTSSAVAEALDPRVLDAAFVAGVLHESGDKIRFEHPLLAETAYRMLPPTRRRAVHRHLAEATADAEERAHHLAACTTALDARVAEAIAIGAEAAAERGAPAAAAELLEASARLEPAPDTAASRRIDAVGKHMASGDNTRAEALGRALVDELPPGPLRSRALTAMAELEGNLSDRIRELEQAVAEARDDREALIQALVWQSVVLTYAGRHHEGRTAIRRARGLCGRDQPRSLHAMVWTIDCYLAHLRGDPDALDLVREAVDLEDEDLLPVGWGAATVLGRGLMSADELDAARPILEEQRRRAMEMGQDESRSAISLFLAEVEMRAGSLHAARVYADDRDRVGGRAMVAAYQGEVDLARRLASSGIEEAEVTEDEVVAAAYRTALGFLEFSLGNDAAALEWFEPAVASFLQGNAGDPGLRHNIVIPDAIEALAGLGRMAEAEELLAAWERAGERFDRPRIHATAARCRALLEAARGDLDAAIAQAEAALNHHRKLPVPFERARTLIVLGTLHRRAKHKAAARAALTDALEILETVGVPLWAERARVELARIGGRATTDGLTPTEGSVADLVAEGLSNKEVAAELFVSVRTVEANLTRIYAKLGIRSRTELAATRPASGGRSRSPAPPPSPPS